MDGDISVINGSLVETDKLGEKLDRENYRGREGMEGSWRERGVLYIIASLIKKFLRIRLHHLPPRVGSKRDIYPLY